MFTVPVHTSGREPSYVPRNPHKSVYALASILTQMADESEEVQAVTVFV